MKLLFARVSQVKDVENLLVRHFMGEPCNFAIVQDRLTSEQALSR
jgi:hypothetical protein